MRSFRGFKPDFTMLANPNQNIWVSRVDGVDIIFRQPRRNDSSRSRIAYRGFTEQTLRKFRRKFIDHDYYDPNRRCKFPLYHGEFPGHLPLIMEVENEIVAFGEAIFRMGVDFPRFNVGSEDRCVTCGIAVIDKFQGMGLGRIYSPLTDCIGRTFNCDWILGTTFSKGALKGIREYDDWQIIREYNGMCDHRKALKERVESNS